MKPLRFRTVALAILALCLDRPAAQAQPRPASAAVAPTPEPPSDPGRTVLPNGRNNWSQAYSVQSMVFLLRRRRRAELGGGDRALGESALADRDAAHPVDRRPYAWTDRSAGVLQPYVWVGFTGHVFAPLMEFSDIVLRSPGLQGRVVGGATLREHALRFVHEYNRALDADRGELADDGRHAYFRL